MADFDRIKETVLKGKVGEIADLVRGALDEGISPQEIIDQGLTSGMNEVGIRFKNDEMYIPEVLVSAKTMHTGMEVLRPLLESEGIKTAGKVALGTVKGDLHDIGKNLVGMMFQGAGFEVIDLGVDQSVENFVEAVRSKGAQVVAMSALLTTTMTEMAGVIEALKQAWLRDQVKVMIGGAPVSQEFADSIGADGYAPDAASAVEKLRELLD
jgi:5-methyltetrahydrofolate--homocysteine methyltransferase